MGQKIQADPPPFAFALSRLARPDANRPQPHHTSQRAARIDDPAVSTTNPATERVPIPKNPNGLISEQDLINDAKRPAYTSSEASTSVIAATV